MYFDYLDIVGLAAIGFSAYLLIKDKMFLREVKEYDVMKRKFMPKVHDEFELFEDQLVLKSERNGEDAYQNYMLFDEPAGLTFNVRNEYEVHIKMTKLKEQEGLNLEWKKGEV